MAERVPPETIELVLSLAVEPPGAEDVDVEREHERRALLRAAALVCRRWRPVATTMLSRSIVIRSADELAAHERAQEDGTLVSDQPRCLTIACLGSRTGEDERVRSLAIAMPHLHYLRIACAALIPARGPTRPWPGRHAVIGDFVCGGGHELFTPRSDIDMWRMLDASPSIRHLSLSRVPDVGVTAIGSEFGARVETLRCGNHSESAYGHEALLRALGTPHLSRLRSVRIHNEDFEEAADAIVGAVNDGPVALCPALKVVHINFDDYLVDLSFVANEITNASRLLNRLPRTCPRLVLELCSSSSGALLVRFGEILARAVDAADDIALETLVFDVRSWDMDEAWRSTAEVVALERACAAKGVELVIHI